MGPPLRSSSPPALPSKVTRPELGQRQLATNKRIDIDVSVDSFVKKCASYVQVSPITPETAVRSVQFPKSYPSDPHDRIIGATAIVEGIRLLTHDKRIVKSGLVPLAAQWHLSPDLVTKSQQRRGPVQLPDIGTPFNRSRGTKETP